MIVMKNRLFESQTSHVGRVGVWKSLLLFYYVLDIATKSN